MCAITVNVIFFTWNLLYQLQPLTVSRSPNTNDTKLDLSSFIVAKVVEDDEALQFLGGKTLFCKCTLSKNGF